MFFARHNFTVILRALSIGLIFLVLSLLFFLARTQRVNAVEGINRTINFQGKLVNNPLKTNVSDTSYTVVFTIYDRASGGTVLWQETQSVTTADGIFRVNLGSVTPIPANFNFNWDGIYLGMKVNSDSEMTPRVQLAAVPYAFNAEKVSGLTVQDTAGNASTSGTLQIPNAETINLGNNSLTFTTSGDTTLILPTTGTVSTLAGSEILTNKTIGSTGLIFSGATTDITTATNEDLNFTANGTANLILGSDFDSGAVLGTSISNEFPLLIRSGIGNNAVLAIDNLNSGDLFVASAAGTTKFRLTNDGSLIGLSDGWNIQATGSAHMSAWEGGGLSDNCDGTTEKIVWNSSTKQFDCGVDMLGEIQTPDTKTFIDLTPVAFADLDTTELFNDTPRPNIDVDSSTTPVLVAVQIRGNASNTANDAFLAARVVYTTDGSAPSCTTSAQAGQAMIGGFTTAATHPWQVIGTFVHVPGTGGNIRYTVCTSAISAGTATDTPEAVEISLTELGSASSNWTLVNGSYVQKISTADVLLGGISTASAVFRVVGQENPFKGTLVGASVSANTSFAALVSNNNGVGDLFTASKSGASKFTVLNNGNLQFAGATNFLSTIVSAATASRIWTLPDSDGTLCLQNSTSCGFGFGTNWWTTSSDGKAIAPINSTMDTLLGGTSSTSAALRIVGQENPFKGTLFAASVSANTSFAGFVVDNKGIGDVFTASTAGVPRFSITNAGGFRIGELQGSLGECLKSGGAGVSLSWGTCGGGGAAGTWNLDSGTGTHYAINTTLDTLFGGTSTASAKLRLASSLTSGLAALIINQTENQDIFTASHSATPRFALGQNGEIKVGLAGNLSAGISGQCLISGGNGTAVSWGGCASGSAGGWWTLQSAQGTLYPVNATLDLLIGGIATDSAKFGFLNVAGGTPTASISANSGDNKTFLTGLGHLGTTNRQTLTIGNSTTNNSTGNILINPNGVGKIGVGTDTPLATFDLRGNVTNNGGTTSVASVSGRTSFAALVVNNSGTGDLFTASTAGQTRFKITNNGSVMIGGDFIAASNTAKLTNNGSPATINGLGDTGSLVPNSSFEVATGSGAITNGFEFAAGWVVSATTSGSVRVDESGAAHGDKALKVQITNNRSAFYSPCFPINTTDTVSYNLGYMYRLPAAPIPTVRAQLATFTSKANCNNNTGTGLRYSNPIPAVAVAVSGANYTAIPLAAITTAPANTGRWGRVEFFVACTTNCTDSIIYIDGVKLDITSLTSSGLDLAENYTGDPQNLARPGDVVKLKEVDGKTVVVPADSVYGKDVIGVVTTKPGLVLDDEMDGPKIPVVLAGRIPVKVSTINGNIKTGYKLTSSSIPGVAIKAIKAGQVIGTAMEDYDSEEQGQIMIHFNLKNSLGGIADSYENVSLESSTFGQDVLEAIKQQEDQGLSGSEIVTDRLIAEVEIVTPKLTVDILHAKKIVADEIEGLSEFENRITQLEEKVATISANITPNKALAVQVEYATISSRLIENEARIEQQNKLMQLISEQLASSSAHPTSNSIASTETSSLTDSLRVKGSALVEGVVTVIDSIITNNFIANGLATFFGDAVFKAKVAFEGPVTFDSDSGGVAVVEKDSDKIQVVFEEEFEETPVLSATVSFEEKKDHEGKVIPTEEMRREYFAKEYDYIIVDKSKKGFVIVLNKKADSDISFTWTAIRVKNTKTVQSRLME